MKVSFLIGGTQKGGTTSLDGYLRGHPSVCMASHKEMHFFDHAGVDYDAYHSHFISVNNNVLYGESTPIYMYWYTAPMRIWKYNPSMRWILCLRNPIERAYSHWNMERTRGREHLDFIDALAAEEQRKRRVLPLQDRVHSYVDRGFYSHQLRRIMHYFPADQILILRSEHLQARPAEEFIKVCEFLRIEPIRYNTYYRVHTGVYSEDMPQSARDYLRDVFSVEVCALEHMLRWDLSEWK